MTCPIDGRATDTGYVLCGASITEPSGRIRWLGCIGRMRGTLLDLADVLENLDELLVTPAPVDGNDRRAARTEGPAPCRLDVLDLTDRRSDTPALSHISGWCRIVSEGREISHIPVEPGARCRWLVRHVDWIARHQAAGELAAEVADAWRWVRASAGLTPPPPVFSCPVVEDGEECGGPVYPLRARFAVRCSRCGSEWGGEEQLKWLGLVLEG